MSDLISKSALKEEIESLAITISGEHSESNNIVNEYKKSVLKVIEEQPTVDEKEIIRKPMERIVEQLQEIAFTENTKEYGRMEVVSLEDALNVVEEEGGV